MTHIAQQKPDEWPGPKPPETPPPDPDRIGDPGVPETLPPPPEQPDQRPQEYPLPDEVSGLSPC
ncbi:hypothetical protein [Parasphingorhabdus sp.]|jgi:hypothetical protein|uniref:hypothetical protein n=1 Tax=Parasphingorhabdus sp. TaxID=2709688 RepID=UPI0007F45D16|nr:hypothetical protein A8B75_07035 [Sphingomonadales bacterium EhC05]